MLLWLQCKTFRNTLYHCNVNRYKLLKYTLPEKINNACSVLLTKFINGHKNLKDIPVQCILIIKTDEIGDLCYAQHVIDILKTEYTHAEITLICKPYAITLVHNNPHLTHITSNWKDLTRNYDLIVDLRVSARSLWYALWHWPKARADRGTVRLRNKLNGKHPHEVITNKQIIEPFISNNALLKLTPQLYLGEHEVKKVTQFLTDQGIRKFAILHPGARKQLRRWDKFKLLAEWLHQEKRLDIVFTGDYYEKKIISEIQKQLTFESHSVAGIFNLAELAALCKEATVYIGNESGPLHIASLCGTPSVGLFGPGEPDIFYPFGPKTTYLHHILPCNPCNQVTCIHPENPCIKRIQLSEVITKIEELLK